MNLKRNLGISFVFLAIIISAVNLNITGAIIGSSLSNSFSFVAIIFLVVGVLLMSQRERNYAQEILDRGAYVSRTREHKKIARRSGYELDGGYR